MPCICRACLAHHLADPRRTQQETDVMRRRAMNEFYQPIRDAMTQSLKDTSVWFWPAPQLKVIC